MINNELGDKVCVPNLVTCHWVLKSTLNITVFTSTREESNMQIRPDTSFCGQVPECEGCTFSSGPGSMKKHGKRAQ